ncbi:unnamed protein product [Penicillium manginii]
MYSCSVCNKSYRLRGSLSRHVRNHSLASSQHVCTTCDVAFSRRDLLRRHLQIHKRPDDPVGSPSVGNEASRPATRQRCHTACQPCREARVKCDGEYPCAHCVSSQTECQFKARAHRVSRIIEVDTAPEHRPDQDEVPVEQHNEDSPSMQAKGADMTAADLFQSPVSNNLDPTTQSWAQGALTPNLDHMDEITEIDFAWANALSSTSTGSWPWLHESLFLQGNDMLNCPDALNSFPIDPLDLAQDARLDLSSFDVSAPQESVTDVQSSTQPAAPVTPITASVQKDTFPSSMLVVEGDNRRLRHTDTTDPRHEMPLQEKLVEELVTHPGNYSSLPRSQLCRFLYWQSMSIRISETFHFDSRPSEDSKSSLFEMMEMYRENFSPLWPLLSGKDFDPDRVHPLLFLTVVSIGCMYGSPQQCRFGNILHERIRHHVADSLIGLEEVGSDTLWLGQARLLTQVAALYFGQRRGFSYAQHLGAIIAAQARRMDLFSTLGSPPTGAVPIEQQLAWWHNDESRKRLAFGILRADIFASVLLNTRPLLSAEEIYLDLPGEDELWQQLDKISQDQLITRLRAELPGTPSLPFCDLVRVAEDREEMLLYMNARGYEQLIFGLQGHVWRFSHDRTMFPRLTGLSDGAVCEGSIPSSSFDRRHSIFSPSNSDQLGITFRQMKDLRRDRRRITEVLQKWEQSFAAVRTTPKFTKDRSSVLSSLLLLHISYLRLCAPLADLHSAAYTLMDEKSFDDKKWQALSEWASSPEANQAVEHVQHIWSLLYHEIKQAGCEKAKFNLLAFSGLHHAAVVTWAFVGAHKEQTGELPELIGLETRDTFPLKQDCNGPILRNYVMAEYLAGHPFPEHHGTTPP